MSNYLKTSAPHYWVGSKIRELSMKLCRMDPWSDKWKPTYCSIAALCDWLQWGKPYVGLTRRTFWWINGKMAPAAVNEDQGEVERREHDPSYDEARDG